jgi:hypothetical protein
MNIKSLILGSAAALVAGGAAQAADLPVAEPVDYVKVCNAYGAGYHFIPGTDTCLKIDGYVRAEFQYKEPKSRSSDTTKIWASTEINFTAKEETELGTLVGFAALDSAENGFDKYYLSIGGLYAGYTDSAANITTTDKALYGSGLGDHDTGALGYNMDLGNGVTLGVALENSRRADIVGSVTSYAGQSLPDVVAALSVAQGWGSAKLGGAIHQIRYANASVGTDYGYYVGAGVNFNLDMLSAGSEIAFSAGYAKGAVNYIKDKASTQSLAGAIGSVNTADAQVTGTTAKLNSIWQVGAALKYAWASNFNTYLTGAYGDYNDATSTNDFKYWHAGFVAEYMPVNNLQVRAGVKYHKTDWSKASTVSGKDVDGWEAKLRLQRDF